MAHIYHLSQGIKQFGHEVKIIAPLSGPPPDFFDKSFISLGKSVPIPTGGSTARISLSLWLEPKIRKLLKEEDFDIIHLHEPLAPILPLLMLHLSKSVNIGTFHAFHGSSKTYWLSKYMLRKWHAKLDGKIAVSKPALDFVNQHFPSDYTIIPNGIDFRKFNQKTVPLTEFQDDKLNILFVGRLEKRKGLRYLLGAFSKLKWEYPKIRLLVVGPGNPEPELFRFIAERNIEDVIFLGGVSGEDLPRYYQVADIFCSPATGGESFGIVLLEAMAAGKPIIASNIDGYASVMSNEKQGLLITPESEEALREALAIVIKDSSLRQHFGSNGLLTAPLYDWEVVTARVLEFYELSSKNKQ